MPVKIKYRSLCEIYRRFSFAISQGKSVFGVRYSKEKDIESLKDNKT